MPDRTPATPPPGKEPFGPTARELAVIALVLLVILCAGWWAASGMVPRRF